MTIVQFNDWNNENAVDKKSNNGRQPEWPLEYMVRIFSSKMFSSLGNIYNKAPLDLFGNNPKVIDIGAGCANHLRFFLNNDCKCTAVDVSEDMCNLAKSSLEKFGFHDVPVLLGNCENVPVEDNSQDIALVMRSIHYSNGKEGMLKSLNELKRILKPNGISFIQTIGSEDDLKKNSTRLDEFKYRIDDYEFRSGKYMALFDDDKHFENTLKEFFPHVEIGELSEKYFDIRFSHYIALCQKK